MSQWTNNLTKYLRGGKTLLAGVGLLLAHFTATASQNVTLTWVPSTDAAVAGFKIYYGPATHTYTNSLTLGLVTNVTVGGLLEGATYYFAATTYGTNGSESDFSNEAIYSIPAIVTPPVTNPPVVIETNLPPVVTNVPPVEVTNSVPVTTNLPPETTNTTVNLNQPPTLNPLADLNLTKNVAGQTIGLSGISSGSSNETQTLVVTVTSSNPSLIKPSVNYQSPKTTGTLTFKPTANMTGSATISVTVNDGGTNNNLITRSFNVVVAASSSSTSTKNNLKRPTFSRFTTNTVTLAGRTIALTANVAGSGPLKYQWKFNDAPISGATSATLSLKNVKSSQSGTYTLTVANAAGSTNASASVVVLESPAATLSAATHAADGSFSFQVNGVPGYKYVIQSSTDLANWSSVKTNTAPFTFTDNSPNADKKFYRSYYSAGL